MQQGFSKPSVVRQISPHIIQEKLNEDLDSLLQLALTGGASEATIISSADVIFDREKRSRANADDGYPSIHWPLDYPKDSVEEAIRAYQSGLFFQVAPGSDMPDYGGGPIPDLSHRERYFKVSEIVTHVESTAFYMAYHLVIGFAAGNCRSIFCADEKRCRAMLKGRTCIQPYKGRPSLAAAGIDTFTMAKNLKFKLPAHQTDPLLAGLVMIV